MSKVRKKVTLQNGFSFVVADRETWEYLVATFIRLGEDFPEGSEERLGWNQLADYFQMEYSLNLYEGEDVDEWE